MSTPSVDLLLRQMAWGVVEPERYSRLTAFGRTEPMLRAFLLAVIAVVSGVVLGARRTRRR